MSQKEMVTVPQAGQVQRQLSPQDQKLASMRGLIAQNMKALTSVLPAHIKPERLARIVTTTLQKTPKLLDCTPASFLGSLLSCAALGLEPDGLLGEAYLIPYGPTCQLIPGYRGLIKLARQSGEVATIDAHEVHLGDEFDFGFGSKPYLVHKPERPPVVENGGVKTIDRAWRPGCITHFYAVAVMRDSTTQFTVMSTWEVDEIRDGSTGYQYAIKHKLDNPWITRYVEMGKKTAIRRLCKYAPSSVEKSQNLQRMITMDERADRGLSQDFENVIDIPALPQDDPEPEDKPADAKPASLSDVAKKSAEERAATLKSKESIVKMQGADGKPLVIPERQPGEDG
jgi:recombination protein RecT